METALRLARQYWKMLGQAVRTKFISLKNGYHGTHFGAASVNGNTVFRRNYEPLLPGCFHIDRIETPWLYRNPFTDDPSKLAQICADLLDREITFQGADTVAAFIAEPVQGAGGVIVPPETYWPLIRGSGHKMILSPPLVIQKEEIDVIEGDKERGRQGEGETRRGGDKERGRQGVGEWGSGSCQPKQSKIRG